MAPVLYIRVFFVVNFFYKCQPIVRTWKLGFCDFSQTGFVGFSHCASESYPNIPYIIYLFYEIAPLLSVPAAYSLVAGTVPAIYSLYAYSHFLQVYQNVYNIFIFSILYIIASSDLDGYNYHT